MGLSMVVGVLSNAGDDYAEMLRAGFVAVGELLQRVVGPLPARLPCGLGVHPLLGVHSEENVSHPWHFLARARSRSAGLPVSAGYTTLNLGHEDHRRAQIAHR
ncbi:hypothetical protein [Streptomyces sp. NPDC048737]|uniref:hypothetical protein n=1 Tax=unclassified Streptomyces TaxID=2593676 RepID=UPI00343EA809